MHLSPRHRPTPFHSYFCPWQLSHGSGISKTLWSVLQLDTFTKGLSWAFFRNPTLPCCAKPQLLYMTPSCLQNEHHLGASYATILYWVEVQEEPLLEYMICIQTLRKHFPENSYFFWEEGGFKPGFLCVTALVVLKLALVDHSGHNSKRSACLSFLSAGIKSCAAVAWQETSS